jgi:hypothetical protein
MSAASIRHVAYASDAFNIFRKYTTLSVSENPHARWAACDPVLSSSASDPSSRNPRAVANASAFSNSRAPIPRRLKRDRTQIPSRNATGRVSQPFTYFRTAISAKPTAVPSGVSAMKPQLSPLASNSSIAAACACRLSPGQSSARISAHTLWSAAPISLTVNFIRLLWFPSWRRVCSFSRIRTHADDLAREPSSAACFTKTGPIKRAADIEIFRRAARIECFLSVVKRRHRQSWWGAAYGQRLRRTKAYRAKISSCPLINPSKRSVVGQYLEGRWASEPTVGRGRVRAQKDTVSERARGLDATGIEDALASVMVARSCTCPDRCDRHRPGNLRSGGKGTRDGSTGRCPPCRVLW